MWTEKFWAQTAERALKTLAQTLLATIAVDGLGLLDIDWPATFGVAGLATVASVLTSIVSAGVGPAGDPSLIAADDDQDGADQ